LAFIDSHEMSLKHPHGKMPEYSRECFTIRVDYPLKRDISISPLIAHPYRIGYKKEKNKRIYEEFY